MMMRRKDLNRPGNGGRFTQPLHGQGDPVDLSAPGGVPTPAGADDQPSSGLPAGFEVKPADQGFADFYRQCLPGSAPAVSAVHTKLGHRLQVIPGRLPNRFRSDRFPGKRLRQAVVAKRTIRDGVAIHILDADGQDHVVRRKGINWLVDPDWVDWVDEWGDSFDPMVVWKICDDPAA